MDDLAFLRERIESYADYTNDDMRKLCDEQIRAYVGEALSRLSERLHPDGPSGDLLARVLLRCQFADQLVVRALDADDLAAARAAAIRAADRDLAVLADRADALAAAQSAEYFGQVETALDARSQAILGPGVPAILDPQA